MNSVMFKPLKDRLELHDDKVRFLDSLAVLMGCKEAISCGLPYGERPDIVRVDSKHGVLFIGDGKNTESPKRTDTQLRLLRYLRWLSAHVSDKERTGIFSICFGRRADSEGWVEAILMLAHEAGLSCQEYGIETFGPGLNVVWFMHRASQQSTANEFRGRVTYS